MIPTRCFVDVITRFDELGGVEPLAILWSDGRKFEIDRILDRGNSASEAGGAGYRFIVKIKGKSRSLYLSNDYDRDGILCWFVESWKAEVNRDTAEKRNKG